MGEGDLLERQALEAARVYAAQLQKEIAALEAEILPLQQKKEELLAKLAAVNKFLSVYEKEKTTDEPPSRKSIADYAFEVLKEEFPQGAHYREILAALAARGIKVGGARPAANLSSYLSRDKRFERIGRGTYRARL